MNPEQSVTVGGPSKVALYILLILSWLSSAYGLWQVFGGSIDVRGLVIAAGALALLLSGAIQVLVGHFWMVACARRTQILLRVMAICGGLAISVVSGALAAAFYLFFVGVDRYENLENQRRIDPIAVELTRFAENLEDISSGFARISRTMKRKMKIETERGASCDGRPVATGPGPRYRLRERLRGEAEVKANEIAAVAAQAIRAARVDGKIDNAAMTAVWERARKIGRSPVIGPAQVWTQDAAAGFLGTHDDPRSGSFTCRDAALVTELQELEQLLATRVRLDPTPPTAKDVNHTDSLKNSFGQVWSVIGPFMGFEVTSDPEAFAATRPAFIMAAGVEIGIIFLVLFRALMEVRPRAARRILKSGRSLSEEERRLTEHVVGVFDRFAVQVGGNTYLFEPQDGDPKLRREVNREAIRFGLKPTKIGQAIAIDQITDEGMDWLPNTYLPERSGGARHYFLWRWNKRAQRFWETGMLNLSAPT